MGNYNSDLRDVWSWKNDLLDAVTEIHLSRVEFVDVEKKPKEGLLCVYAKHYDKEYKRCYGLDKYNIDKWGTQILDEIFECKSDY